MEFGFYSFGVFVFSPPDFLLGCTVLVYATAAGNSEDLPRAGFCQSPADIISAAAVFSVTG